MTEALNAAHGVQGFVHFEAGEGGLPKAVLTNPAAGSKLEVYLYGAHITSWTTSHGEQLFMSKKSIFGQGKAIRGGVPIIFPQFGPGKIQNHGFARNTSWEVAHTGVSKSDPAVVSIDLRLKESKSTLDIWPHAFEAILSIHLSTKLALEFKVHNTGKEAFNFQSALHTYFTVSDIKNASVVGLKDVTLIDKVKGGVMDTESRTGVIVGEEVDRVYLNVKQDPLLLVDKAKEGSRKLFREGFSDVVVWNPWVEKARGLADLGEEAYPSFICVEVGQIGTPAKLNPGEQWVGKHVVEHSNQASL